MKKGLFSILAGALLVVGCQNYDDQFSNIESQITALASQVAGLSQVQSDLTALAGTVNSLQTSVAQTVDAALADGLADIDTAVASLEAATANAASSEDVAAIAAAVADNQTDLDELLANSSVFNGDITINSEATLAAFKAIGGGLAIVNGNVTIAVSAAMNQADVQTVVDEILTVTKDFTYTAADSTIAETTFNNLSGVQTMTLKQAGGYKAQGLVSASKIVLNDNYKSTVAIVDFRGLTTVSTIKMDEAGTEGQWKFNKATELHLTSLALYGTGGLDLQVKKGGVIALTALDDLNSLGTAVGSTYVLKLDGPASATNANIGDGELTFTNVATVSVSGFIGKTIAGVGVENLTIDGAVDLDISAASDLEVVSITGALDSDATLATADKAGPAVTFASTDLTTATIAGVVASIDASDQSNLETLTITADTKGGALTIHDNDDLVTVTVTGAKLGNVEISENGDLEAVTLDHTTTLAALDLGATLSVTNNANMTSFTWSADDVDSLTMTGNTQLATINFAGLADNGTSTAATANVQSNALVSTTTKNQYDAVPATTDRGSFVSVSGMATLKIWLTDALTATTQDIEVYFDTIELVQNQSGSATAAYLDAVHTDAYASTEENAVAYAKTTAASGRTTLQTVSVAFPLLRDDFGNVKDNTTGDGIILTNAIGSFNVIAPAAGQDVAGLVAALNGNTGLGAGTVVTAAQDSFNEGEYAISWTTSDSGVAATASADGSVYFTYGTNPLNGSTISGTTADVLDGENQTDVAERIATKLNAVQSAYVATTTGNKILITALVSGTNNEDRGPLSHPLNTLTIGTTVLTASGSLLWAGEAEKLDSSATSNLTAAASSMYNLQVTKVARSGIRVTLANQSSTLADNALASTPVLGTDTMTAAGGAAANNVALSPAILTSSGAGQNIIGSATSSSTLDYVATFAQRESAVAASTTTVNRTTWL